MHSATYDILLSDGLEVLRNAKLGGMLGTVRTWCRKFKSTTKIGNGSVDKDAWTPSDESGDNIYVGGTLKGKPQQSMKKASGTGKRLASSGASTPTSDRTGIATVPAA